MALIGREAVAMAILYKAENELNTIAISGLELTVKEHEEEIATLRKKVQEQEEEIKRLKGGDSDETVPHIEGAKES